MKKILLLSVVLFLSFQAFSQVKIGLKFSPGIGLNRVYYDEKDSPGATIKPSSFGIRFIAGPEVAFFFGKNAAFVTGVWYSSRRAGLKVTTPTAVYREVHNLQYVQLPAYLKLLTNEIATDMRVYFNVGGTFDILLKDKLAKSDIADHMPNKEPYIRRFVPVDATVLLGAGVELQMGESTYATFGLSYNRGLINSVWKVNENVTNPGLKINTDLIAIDLGLRF
ncbi:MAG: porin family protein [Cytophagaceae bacterium]